MPSNVSNTMWAMDVSKQPIDEPFEELESDHAIVSSDSSDSDDVASCGATKWTRNHGDIICTSELGEEKDRTSLQEDANIEIQILKRQKQFLEEHVSLLSEKLHYSGNFHGEDCDHARQLRKLLQENEIKLQQMSRRYENVAKRLKYERSANQRLVLNLNSLNHHMDNQRMFLRQFSLEDSVRFGGNSFYYPQETTTSLTAVNVDFGHFIARGVESDDELSSSATSSSSRKINPAAAATTFVAATQSLTEPVMSPPLLRHQPGSTSSVSSEQSSLAVLPPRSHEPVKTAISATFRQMPIALLKTLLKDQLVQLGLQIQSYNTNARDVAEEKLTKDTRLVLLEDLEAPSEIDLSGKFGKAAEVITLAASKDNETVNLKIFSTKQSAEYKVLTSRPGHANIPEVISSLMTSPSYTAQHLVHNLKHYEVPEDPPLLITTNYGFSLHSFVQRQQTTYPSPPYGMSELFYVQCLYEVTSALQYLASLTVFLSELSCSDVFLRVNGSVVLGNLHRAQAVEDPRLASQVEGERCRQVVRLFQELLCPELSSCIVKQLGAHTAVPGSSQVAGCPVDLSAITTSALTFHRATHDQQQEQDVYVISQELKHFLVSVAVETTTKPLTFRHLVISIGLYMFGPDKDDDVATYENFITWQQARLFALLPNPPVLDMQVNRLPVCHVLRLRSDILERRFFTEVSTDEIWQNVR